MKYMSLVGLMVCGAVGALAAAPAIPAPPATNAVYDVVLRKADTNAVALHVCLRAEGGKFTAGVTVGPLGPTEIDCTGLALNGNAVTGSLKGTVGFDGFFPSDGKPMTHEYRLDAVVTDGTVRGKYEGTVTPGQKVSGTVEGNLLSPPDLRGYWVMDLQMENGAGAGTLGPKSYGSRVYPKLFMKDGKWVQSLIYGWGKRVQINYFESEIVTNALRFDGKTLTGPLAVRATGGSDYLFTFDGIAVGGQIGGTYKKQVDGNEVAGGPFHGKLEPMPERSPAQALHYLELHRAVVRTWDTNTAATALQLMVSVPCIGGKFGAGVAYAAAWNHVFHDVDASGLKLDGNSVAGELKVTMNPDPYMPPDHKGVSATYRIDAKISDGRIVGGTYTGLFKDRTVSGSVFGELMDQPPVPEPVGVNFKLEDGVNDGSPWHRRTWINFVATKGHAETGGMFNNKGGWKGTFKKAEVKFDAAAFTATVDGTVDETKGVLIGAYTFKLTGRVVGAELIGICDTYRDGKLTKSGTPFMGGFSPVKNQPPSPGRPP